ncbi:hypothetical protein FA15DRAFT_725999 [Coprinopsis marcescibilis]|uniref:Mitochondrial outer membrane transport complex Sam37/metaxin N-terminal domain-containing protein n=1 Tax=Coprinopsis marcescibilis TaxID=230819 RepID=A0A5C3LBZ9_COPMA|nr:hypothetical protein FA15DRAFT_725999 [Coprinopsis marcescibilis]
MASTDQVTLYVWPKLWDLPSFDPYCLTAILFLQLALPGKFAIIECTDVDLSPSGQLPFLVHGQEVKTDLNSIVKYLSGLATTEGGRYPHANIDRHLSSLGRSQKNAWLSHTESNLGDLVAWAFYSQDNWEKSVHNAVAALLPVPQRYFVPYKLRATYHPRLEAAGLWSHVESPEKKSAFEKEMKLKPKTNKTAFQKVFEKEKTISKAKVVLDIYARLLEGKRYVYQDRVSSVDVAIAARIRLLVKPSYVDDTLKTLISVSYPQLVAHSDRVFEHAFGSNSSPLSYQPYIAPLFSRFSLWRPSIFRKAVAHNVERTEEERQTARMRWLFLGLSIGSVFAYIGYVGGPYLMQVWQTAKAIAAEQEAEEHRDGEEEEVLALP